MKRQQKALKLVVDTSIRASREVEPAGTRARGVRERRSLKARSIDLEGLDELVLHCGKASITLHKDGRVVIQGTYVETRSSGTNRIKGATVKLN